jgi:hypothetical protein
MGVVLITALKISLLSSLPANALPFILVASLILSRFQPLLIMRIFDYVRNDASKSGTAMYKPD